VCLIECRGFNSKDFAKYHPGGSLGKKLYLKVSDIYPNHELPTVKENSTVKEAIMEISSKRLGATAVLKENEELAGIITDGDVRRMLNQYDNFAGLTAKDIMTINPKAVSPDDYAVEALQIMQEKNITQLVVVQDNKPLGFVHLHDLLKEGLI
jgi:arabinose-5-phosphate isomerase